VSQNNFDKFEVGDLVMYAPYYIDEGDGSWVMSGDIGVVVQARIDETKSYQVVKVQWANEGIQPVDMSSDVLKKITLDKQL